MAMSDWMLPLHALNKPSDSVIVYSNSNTAVYGGITDTIQWHTMIQNTCMGPGRRGAKKILLNIHMGYIIPLIGVSGPLMDHFLVGVL